MECGPITGRRNRRNAAFCTPSRIPWPEQKRLHTQHLSTLIAMAITVNKAKSTRTAATAPAGVDELLSPLEIQGWIKVSRPTFYRLLKEKRLPRHDLTVGCKPRWKRSTIQAWIDAQATQAKG